MVYLGPWGYTHHLRRAAVCPDGAAPDRRNVDEIDEVSLTADGDRLKQLILILVDNAIRYTPAEGQVRLSLRKDGAMAVLEVADNGIGISAEDLPRIFDRFYRADKARVRDAGGTGLGLAIARWIVEQHGGEVAVSSEQGKGSTFTVCLPLTARCRHQIETGVNGLIARG